MRLEDFYDQAPLTLKCSTEILEVANKTIDPDPVLHARISHKDKTVKITGYSKLKEMDK